MTNQWEIPLFSCGNCGVCCFSFCCPCCALAEARNKLDGSFYLTNCCFLGAAPGRWLVRTAYGIEGNAHWDCWIGAFCCCCAINQMLATVNARGRVQIPDVGEKYNVKPGRWLDRGPLGLCYDGWYSLICIPCATGLAMKSAGMPCWFGSCCVNPVVGASILRYHHRINPSCCGSEALTDCWVPCLCNTASQLLIGTSNPLVGIAYSCGILSEENIRQNRDGCYGCNCIGAIAYGCKYLVSCNCSEPEGRYLSYGNEVVATAVEINPVAVAVNEVTYEKM